MENQNREAISEKLDLKITIEQLKNYLGTGLKFEKEYIYRGGQIETGISELDEPAVMYLIMNESFSFIKPICYRLSDLDKHIPELGFVPAKELDDSCRTIFYPLENLFKPHGVLSAPFQLVNQLIKWHFWPFGDQYFEAGLVIDKSEIANPKSEISHV